MRLQDYRSCSDFTESCSFEVTRSTNTSICHVPSTVLGTKLRKTAHACSGTAIAPNAGTRRPSTAFPWQLNYCRHRNRNRHLEVTPSRRSAERRNPAQRLSQSSLTIPAGPSTLRREVVFPSFLLSWPRSVTLMDIHSLQSTDKAVADSQWH